MLCAQNVCYNYLYTSPFFRVDSNSDANKMTARNLAVIFAPTVMRAPEVNILVQDLPLQRTFVEYLINYHEILFKC